MFSGNTGVERFETLEVAELAQLWWPHGIRALGKRTWRTAKRTER